MDEQASRNTEAQAEPPPPPEVRAARRADRDADLEVEQRSRITAPIWLLLAVGYRLSPAPSQAFVELMNAAITAMIFCIALRIGGWLYGRGYPPGSRARRFFMFAPFLLQVTVWTAITTTAMVQHRGTWFADLAMMVQCLGAASAVVSYSARAPLAAAIVGILVLPPASVLIVGGAGSETTVGVFALIYAALNWTVLPRLARERRSAMVSMGLLEERAHSLEEARDATLAAASAKDAFFANLSHEIRTPLHGLLGIVERLKATPLSVEQAAAVQQLDRSGQRLLATLNDALDSARLESGQLTLRREPFELGPLVSDVVALFSDEARHKGIVLELVSPAPLAARVVGDPQRLRQVLQNLVGNAVKFTPQGAVTVTARSAKTDRDAVELSVTVVDTGIGFDARESARLFQRFSQLSEGTTGGGTGLGLAISAELVRLMGGEIDGSSPGRGRGAEFSIHVPLPLAPPALDALRGRRVLVVDDNAVNVSVARAYLAGLGVHVDEALSGDAAIARVEAERYDAILMDCQMPGKDGLETTRQLRARGDTTPVVAITAADDEGTRARCVQAGMNGFVLKPVSPAALRDALSRVLAR